MAGLRILLLSAALVGSFCERDQDSSVFEGPGDGKDMDDPLEKKVDSDPAPTAPLTEDSDKGSESSKAETDPAPTAPATEDSDKGSESSKAETDPAPTAPATEDSDKGSESSKADSVPAPAAPLTSTDSAELHHPVPIEDLTPEGRPHVNSLSDDTDDEVPETLLPEQKTDMEHDHRAMQPVAGEALAKHQWVEEPQIAHHPQTTASEKSEETDGEHKDLDEEEAIDKAKTVEEPKTIDEEVESPRTKNSGNIATISRFGELDDSIALEGDTMLDSQRELDTALLTGYGSDGKRVKVIARDVDGHKVKVVVPEDYAPEGQEEELAFDCHCGTKNWRELWSAEQKKVCCEETGISCEGPEDIERIRETEKQEQEEYVKKAVLEREDAASKDDADLEKEMAPSSTEAETSTSTSLLTSSTEAETTTTTKTGRGVTPIGQNADGSGTGMVHPEDRLRWARYPWVYKADSIYILQVTTTTTMVQQREPEPLTIEPVGSGATTATTSTTTTSTTTTSSFDWDAWNEKKKEAKRRWQMVRDVTSGRPKTSKTVTTHWRAAAATIAHQADITHIGVRQMSETDVPVAANHVGKTAVAAGRVTVSLPSLAQMSESDATEANGKATRFGARKMGSRLQALATE